MATRSPGSMPAATRPRAATPAASRSCANVSRDAFVDERFGVGELRRGAFDNARDRVGKGLGHGRYSIPPIHIRERRHGRLGTHHRRRGRAPARAHRHPRAASDAAALPLPTTTRSATSRWRTATTTRCGAIPTYGAKTRWERPIASPSLVGGDTLIGEDEVTEVAPEHRDLMKGDPLRGVHAFYSASAREWWAPLRPLRRVSRRNALVAVLDKPSEFAGRAIHEWTAQVFRDDDGTLLSGQYRLMIRTEREKARERKKYDDDRAPPLHRRRDRRDRSAVRPRSAPRGAEPRWWEDVDEGDEVGPMVKGPLTVTDMVCWHVGMGMGLYGVKPLRLAPPEPPADPALLPPRRAQRPRRDAARALGPGVRAPVRATRPPSTTAACARRGSSTSAPTGWATTPGSGSSTASSASSTTSATRNGCAGTVVRKYLADGDRPAVDLELDGREPARRGHDARPRDDPAPEPRARPGAAARSARRRRATSQGALDAISARVRAPMTDFAGTGVDGLAVALDDGVLRLTLDRPEKRNAIDDTMMAGLIDAVDAAGTDERVRVIVLDGAGDHFCGGADIVARNARDRRRAPRAGSIQRRLPAQAHRLDPAALRRCRRRSCARCAAGPRASASSSRSPPTSPSPPTTPRFWEPFAERGFTPDSGATWLLPRRVGEVRARELLLLGRELTRHRSGRVGRDPPRPCPRPSSTARSTRVVGGLAHGPDRRARAHEVAAAPGRGAVPRTATRRTRRSRWSSRRAPRTSARASRRSREQRPPRVRRPMKTAAPLAVDRDSTPDAVVAAVRAWVDEHVPRAWIDAAHAGGAGRDPGGAPACRLRGLVPDVRGVRARRADLAGRVRRSRSRAGDGPRSSRPSCGRSTSAG